MNMQRIGYARGLVAVMAVAMLGWVGLAGAGELETQGRAVFEKNQKAIVTVQMVVKQKMSGPGMPGEDNESKEEATGFVIDPSGLTVLSLSATDPSSLYENMMASMGEMAEQIKIESTMGEVKILLDDGTEVPAQIVLRDKDLDLAFVRPTQKPAQPLAAVDLAQSGEAGILDSVIVLSRLGKVAGRVCSANVERIQAVVRRPRMLYVPGNDPTHSGLGSPAFLADGKVLGIIVLRTIKSEGKGSPMSMMGGMEQGMMAVVVPAADIQEGAKQAPEAKPEAPAAAKPEAKPAEAKPEEKPAEAKPESK